MNSTVFWLTLTQPRTWSLSDVSIGQFVCAMLCVVLSIVIVAAVRWYCDKRARLNRAEQEIAAIEAALKEIER